MNVLEIITKKKENKSNSKEEIEYLVKQYLNGIVPDYQMSSWLMAVTINGMNREEIYSLTDIMLKSGKIYSLKEIKGYKIDKHSTGGLGDKISLIFPFIMASFGINVSKISGKSLGYTGGTIDKLESFKNFKVDLYNKEFIESIKKTNVGLISQNDDLVPADKKIYSLRNVTSTVNSIPLIASSIMSKKLAIDSDLIILDIKCNSTVSLSNLKIANKLANIMIDIAKNANRKSIVILSDMSQPLGKCVGNKIEIFEAIKFLQGKYEKNLYNLIIKLSSLSLVEAKKFSNEKQAEKAILENLKLGKPLKKFKEFFKFHKIIDEINKLEKEDLDKVLSTKNKIEIKAKTDGFVFYNDLRIMGEFLSILGVSQIFSDNKIDYNSGIYLNKKNNDKIKKGELVFTFYTNRYITKPMIETAYEIFSIKKNNFKSNPIIYKIIK